MPERKPRRMIGTPRAPRPAKGDWQWGLGDLAIGCLPVLVIALIEIAAALTLIWLAIEYALPWVIDVVIDAVEQRD